MIFKHFSKQLALTLGLLLPITVTHANDVEKGRVIFQQCSICHSNEKAAAPKVGPNLWNVINRDVAKDSAYQGRYSAALQKQGGLWSVDRISAFIENPQNFASGTYMGFAGLSNATDRADLIAFLNSQSDAPISYKLEVGVTKSDASSTESNIGKLFRAPGAQTTFRYCSACHSERIVTQQGLIKADWEELLEWMIDEQGMDQIEEPDYSSVIEYLSTHYGTDRPNFPKK